MHVHEELKRLEQILKKFLNLEHLHVISLSRSILLIDGVLEKLESQTGMSLKSPWLLQFEKNKNPKLKQDV